MKTLSPNFHSVSDLDGRRYCWVLPLFLSCQKWQDLWHRMISGRQFHAPDPLQVKPAEGWVAKWFVTSQVKLWLESWNIIFPVTFLSRYTLLFTRLTFSGFFLGQATHTPQLCTTINYRCLTYPCTMHTWPKTCLCHATMWDTHQMEA